MIRGAGNIGFLKRERLTDTGHALFGVPVFTSDAVEPGTVELRAPLPDRVRDGRHVMDQDDPLIWFGARTVRPHPRTHVSRRYETEPFLSNSSNQENAR